jgi:NAD(P)H-nitrite reductase large subunit
MNYRIIGNGIAGISAAKTIREHDATSKITLYTTEVHPFGFYARKDMARRLAQGPVHTDDFLLESEAHLKAQGIELIYDFVLKVFPNTQQLLMNHAIRLPYDRLLLAMGSTPKLVDAPGIHLLGVHQMGNGQDVNLIEGWMPELQQHGVVVIGGGILGLDMAYALRQRGLTTTLIVREDQVMAGRIHAEAARLIEARLQADGIRLLLNSEVRAYQSDDDKLLDRVELSTGEVLPTRMALCTVGVHPNSELIEESGIEIDEATAGIRVNRHMQTNFPQVYAAGSVAAVEGLQAYHWQMAAEQGRIAGLNMLGQPTEYAPALLGQLDTHLYDLPFAYLQQSAAPQATPTDWTLANGQGDYAHVRLVNGAIQSAILLGSLVQAGQTLWDWAEANQPTDSEALKALFA